MTNNFGSTPLHLACEYGYLPIVKVRPVYTIKNALNMITSNYAFSYFPQHCYILSLNQMLIEKKAPLFERDSEGDGPMHWAAKRGDMEIMCTMKSAGACPKFPGLFKF